VPGFAFRGHDDEEGSNCSVRAIIYPTKGGGSMQSASPHASTTIRYVNDMLKIALPVFALIATGLGIAGDKWDKEKRRPTKVGYAALTTGLLVAVVSIGSWRTDNQVKGLDSAASESRQAAAVAEQKQRDQAHFDQTHAELSAVNTALTQANSAQEAALAIVLRQLPIDEIELSLKRSEIQNVLPKELKAETFSFQKGPGWLSMDHDDFVLFQITPRDNSSSLGSFRSGQTGVKSFHSVVDGICQINITPASIPAGEIPTRLRIGDEFYLTAMVVDRNFLTYRFVPDGVSVAYFDGSRARLEIVTPIAVAFGNAELPPTKSCVIPDELRLRVRSFGFISDTGLFKVNWTQHVGSFIALSPVLRFTSSKSPNQPPPPR